MRKIHNDSSLDQQRKAYLSQNIMASKYIVAQQKRMHAITCSHGVRSFADAGRSVLGCSHYQRGCASGLLPLCSMSEAGLVTGVAPAGCCWLLGVRTL